MTYYNPPSGGGGSAVPGGPDSSVQYAKAGAFAGEAAFSYDDAANVLAVAGEISAESNRRVTTDPRSIAHSLIFG